MMHEICGADCQPRIPGSRLQVDLLKWRLIENLAVGQAIEGYAARQANRFLFGAGMQRAEHLE